MNLAAAVIDQHDDPELTVLRRVFSTRAVPALIKEAQLLDEPVLRAMPNEEFALCAVDNGQLMRKFATVTKPSTALSVIYFMETHDQLPIEAQKVAAANLVSSCFMHDLQPPTALLKLAEGAEDLDLVDVSGKSAPTKVAAPGEGVTLNSPTKIAHALQFFEENHKNMHPRERRKLASSLVKTAASHNVELTDAVGRYGSETYAASLQPAFVVRAGHLGQDDEAGLDLLSAVFEKAAAIEPSKFAEALAEFDIGMGLDRYWDRGIQDPWASTFGQLKFAEFTYVDGADRVTETDLQTLAQKPGLLRDSFSADIVDAFAKDPVTIFESLPMTHKKIISRIASDSYTGGTNRRVA